MKAFVLHLIQISHLQWIFRNFTLHNKQRGYLSLLKRATVLKKVDWLLDMAPENIPAGSQYLLELDYSALYNASLERQLYWVLAMKLLAVQENRMQNFPSAEDALRGK